MECCRFGKRLGSNRLVFIKNNSLSATEVGEGSVTMTMYHKHQTIGRMLITVFGQYDLEFYFLL